ncbi:MAG: 3-keto-5-aminohexanoate cleavage protein [Labedaea sp.]
MGWLHLHPRDGRGVETLDGGGVAATVEAVRAVVAGVEIGVSTGAWIQPDPAIRRGIVRAWAALGAGRPDVASVNVHEDGWTGVCAALHAAGIGIELGVFHRQAAEALRASGIPPGTVRVLAEVQDAGTATDLLDALAWTRAPLLLHGQNPTAWPVLREAIARGLATRIGLEDTLHLPDGTLASSNADLVSHAKALARAGSPTA